MPFFSTAQRRSNKEQKPPHTKIRGLKEAGRRSNSDQAEVNPPFHRTKKKYPYRRTGASTDIKASNDESDEAPPLPPPASKLEAGLPRFGPIYGDDTEAYRTAKHLAWGHILIGDSEGHYLSSISRIQATAVEFYDPTVKEKMKLASYEFVQRMARDGCFFLQLALHVLGCGDLLGYSDEHPYFGKHTDIDSDYWIRAMFTVGNQIPHVVIRALAKQAFFRKAIKKGIERGTLRQPPKGLPKLMLYLTVVEPEDNNKPRRLISSLYSTLTFQEPPPRLPDAPTDLLHALHSYFLGSRNDPVYSEIKEFRDLEAGREQDEEIRFPSAGELLKSSIRLRKGKNGIANIHFQNLYFRSYLYVPPFIINAHTEHVLRTLTSYEQNLDDNDREVTAYLRFIRDLAQTYKSFKILEKKGIIQVEEEELKYTVVDMLNKFVASQKCNYTISFRHIRNKIKDYGGPPWGLISFLLGVFTFVQTLFTVLSYFRPPK